jgi:hypothetical protein
MNPHERSDEPSERKWPPKSTPQLNQHRRNRKRCRDNQPGEHKATVLWWNSPVDHVPIASEEAMIDVLVKWKKTERGMIKDQPPFRLAQIRKQLHHQAPSMTLAQASSLRRHHMKQWNPKKPMSFLRLGKDEDIRNCAAAFEHAVECFLRKCHVEYWTEEEQKRRFADKIKQGGKLFTPDFLLPEEIVLKKVRGHGNDLQILEERTIHWIEAKMFYGASTIPHGTPSAVGSILPKAKKYVEEFGEGAIVFMYGCGDRLAADLAEIGVTVLECSGTVSLKKVHEHQRKWCANQKGEILP